MEAPRARYSYMLRPFVTRRIRVVYFLLAADTRDAVVLRARCFYAAACFVAVLRNVCGKRKHVKMLVDIGAPCADTLDTHIYTRRRYAP